MKKLWSWGPKFLFFYGFYFFLYFYLPCILLILHTVVLVVAVFNVRPTQTIATIEAVRIELLPGNLCGSLGRSRHHDPLAATLNDHHACSDGPSKTLLLIASLLLGQCNLLGLDSHLHEGNVGHQRCCSRTSGPGSAKSRELLLRWCLFFSAPRRLIRVIVHEESKPASDSRCDRRGGLLGLHVLLDALNLPLALSPHRVVPFKDLAILDRVTSITTVAAVLSKKRGAHSLAVGVLGPMAAILRLGLARILAHLAARLADNVGIAARHFNN